ncbi:hypothetical protein BCR34DRAFT_556857 [Clohesyomyces aquaticus]|uniref:Uncharacterized protein n=1 Tax=Clohesyomyces aquaticus TaxID=1231657 RepID=A0A1Y2A234_9PLEO|nr:hypothetical protein BCR34DRAFT_556857 [Clohesyomyces aquaticus]
MGPSHKRNNTTCWRSSCICRWYCRRIVQQLDRCIGISSKRLLGSNYLYVRW